MKKSVLILLSMVLISCDEVNNNSSTETGSLELELVKNNSWPYEVQGSLEIIDAGSFDEGNYANWAIGSIDIQGTDEILSVEFGPDVLKAAGVDDEFNYGTTVILWLGKPKEEYGDLTFPVKKMRK